MGSRDSRRGPEGLKGPRGAGMWVHVCREVGWRGWDMSRLALDMEVSALIAQCSLPQPCPMLSKAPPVPRQGVGPHQGHSLLTGHKYQPAFAA